MTVVRGTIREVGRSTTFRVSASRWYGSTSIVIQDESTGTTYDVVVSANVMERCRFLPRVGMKVVVHGYVERAETGLSDYRVSHVTDVKHEGADVKRVIRFDDDAES